MERVKLPIVEEKTNFPTALGYKNRPPTRERSGSIGEQAMALVRGVTPIHLAQRFRGKKSQSLSVHSEYETYVHNLNTQMTKYPLVPVLDRPHPILDMIKATPPILPRVKLIGAFGIVDPEELLAVEKNIPRPYPRPMEWAPGKLVATIPSAIADIRDGSGPERTVHPSLSVEM